jgi:hypothetical protein
MKTRLGVLTLVLTLSSCSSNGPTVAHDPVDASGTTGASTGGSDHGSFGGGGVGGSSSRTGGTGTAGTGTAGAPISDAARPGAPDAQAPNTDTGAIADAASRTDGQTGATCASFVRSTALEAKRNACTFVAGAKVKDTVEDATAARSAITHLIVVTHENRSFDHMYGTIGHGMEGFPSTYTNPDATGKQVSPTHLTTACPADISHSVASITAEWDNGKMDGFVKTDVFFTAEARTPTELRTSSRR